MDTCPTSVRRRYESLFSALDPRPLSQRELAPEVVAQISEWLDFGRHRNPSGFRVIVYVDDLQPAQGAAEVEQAMRNGFAQKEKYARRQFHLLMGEGKRSLLISISFAAIILPLAAAIWGSAEDMPLLASGSLSIAMWVVLWRPIEIYFYDWGPIVVERRMWERLSESAVELRPSPTAGDLHEAP